MNINTSGGNGNRGQFGAPGIRGTDRTSKVQRFSTCLKSIQQIDSTSNDIHRSYGDDDDDCDHYHGIIICFRSPLPDWSVFIMSTLLSLTGGSRKVFSPLHII